jgi:hypothetical protein
MKTPLLRAAALALLVADLATAQMNSGSNGSDGALNPTSNVVIDMADHPDGIYHYTSVNTPAGVEVSFIPNTGNTPVVWLVQGDCPILGYVRSDGGQPSVTIGGKGGPGGFRGGFLSPTLPTPPGEVYGNNFLAPLVGGSGALLDHHLGKGRCRCLSASDSRGLLPAAASGSTLRRWNTTSRADGRMPWQTGCSHRRP